MYVYIYIHIGCSMIVQSGWSIYEQKGLPSGWSAIQYWFQLVHFEASKTTGPGLPGPSAWSTSLVGLVVLKNPKLFIKRNCLPTVGFIPKDWQNQKSPAPRFCCTAAITTSCMLLKPGGTDFKIRPFSRTFFKTLSLRGYGSQLGTLKIGWLLKMTKNLQFTPKQLWVPSVFVLVSKFSSRRPGCSFRSASSTRKPSASLNRSTDPSGKATREKVDVEAETAEACDTVMLTGLFASPWKQNEMNFKSYSCGESASENLEFDLRPRAAGFFRSLPPRSKVSLLQLWLGAKVLQPNPSRSFQEQTSQEPFSLAPRFTLKKKK